jgi:hypothetical protein
MAILSRIMALMIYPLTAAQDYTPSAMTTQQRAIVSATAPQRRSGADRDTKFTTAPMPSSPASAHMISAPSTGSHPSPISPAAARTSAMISG